MKKMKKYIGIGILLLILACVIWADTADDQTAALTRQTDTRKNVDYPVWDVIVTASFDANDTGNATQAVTINGIIQKVVFVTPDATNTVTYQVEILDNEDEVIFDSGEQAENATYTFSLYEPVTGTIDVRVGPSGAMGATNPDVTVTLRGI